MGASARRLDGRVAIITGAARGQGEATARRFAEEGARVVVTDVLEAEAKAVAGYLDGAIFRPLDVTDEGSWGAVVEDVVAELGGVDALVNNAGIVVMAPMMDTSAEDMRRVFEVNQLGVFLGMKAVIPAMKPGGSIVNISSIDGLIGTEGLFAYASTKFAVTGMTRTAALELGALGIRVNSIHPGIINTAMIEGPGAPEALQMLLPRVPLGRVAEPSEVAALSAFLASDDGSYCTGAQFTVDGGMTAGPYFGG